MTDRPLRPHQIRGLDRLRQALLDGRKAPMFQAPTGFGKTRVMAEIVNRALDRGRRVLITVPAISLVDQTIAELEAEGITDIGVIQAQHDRTDSAASVQVASVQTLERRKMPACDLVLIDEAHRWFRSFEAMIADAKARDCAVIGLSATPWTKGLGLHFDDLIQVVTTQELIEQGYLSPFRVFAPSHPDLEDVRVVAGDFHEGDLGEVMNKPELVADIVTTWLQLGERRPTLCFAVDRAHAKELQLSFEASGVRAGYIDAYTPGDERAKIRHRFHTGEIEVVCNVGCMTTGIDWDVRCIILARPTRSEMLFVQIIGRGLRTAEGKADLIILDHSDTHLRLGFVTDIHRDKLSAAKKGDAAEQKARIPKPQECSQCHYVRPAKVHKCANCGFAPERQCEIEVGDGELIEFGAERKKRVKAAGAEMAAFYAELKMYGARKGYSSGWAANQHKEKWGTWPNAYRDVAPREPSPTTLSWIRSRQIAYAKRRKTA